MNDISEEYSDARVSRTARYRKVTKPLLERRRRARINRCLEELKDLMVGALEVERENINKLEKADILELTVRHLSKLKGPRDIKAEAERFQAGFGSCAAEAYHFILSTPGVDQTIIQQLVKHLSTQINDKANNHVQPPVASPAPSTSSSLSSANSSHSPDYPLDYPQTSPVSLHEEERIRYQHNPPKEISSSVPVEKSLTCDVSSYNAHAVMRRHGDCGTGLLMTVNDPRRMPNYVPEYPPPNMSEVSSYKRGPMEVKDQPPNPDQNAERKNIILRKIREHIMERQHREPDSTTSVRSEVPTQNQREAMRRYRVSPGHRSAENTDVFREQQAPVSYSVNQSANKKPVCDNIKEEAVNLSNDNKKYVGDTRRDSFDDNPIVSSSQNVAGRKRQYTDYKSIHPKKVLIRAPNLSNEGISDNKEVQDRYKNDVDSRRIAEIQTAKGSNPDKGNLFKEGFQRYKNHFFNLEKEEYYRDPNLDQDDMWRPW